MAGKTLPKWAPAGVVRGNGEHILYLDDEEALVYLAKCFMEQLGYRVTGHTIATAALASFRTNPRDFDLVVTDLNMPGMSGLDVAQQLREIQPDALIVLTSGYMRPEEIEKAHALGIQSTVPKPNTIGHLCLVVQKLLLARASGNNG